MADLKQVAIPSKGALVLELLVLKFEVCWIQINLDSSIDLLHVSTFKQMGFALSSLESLSKLLKWFIRSTTRSIGEMELSVKVGPTTLNVQFSVVSDPSPYNAKLRWAWLNEMKATLLNVSSKDEFHDSS